MHKEKWKKCRLSDVLIKSDDSVGLPETHIFFQALPQIIVVVITNVTPHKFIILGTLLKYPVISYPS